MESIMAKKSAGPKAAASGEGPRRAVLQMKGTPAWKRWLDELAEHVRLPTSTLVDHALIEYAKSRGFNKKPPKR